MWLAVGALVLTACRFGFDATTGGTDALDAPDGATGAFPSRCTIPQRPDTSVPGRIVTTCTESEARAAFAAGGVVALQCAPGTVIALTQPLVAGAGLVVAANGVTFDGQDLTGVMRVPIGASLTLLDATVRRGRSTGNGAGILVEFGGALVVYDSVFLDNRGPTAGAVGGAIAGEPSNATVEVYGSRFEGNESASGGALSVYAKLTIAESVLRDNRATGAPVAEGAGGAIQATGQADFSLCEVDIANNTANGNGGGIFRVVQSPASVDRWERVHLVGNVAAGGVGGAYVQDMRLTLRQVDVADNQGTFIGGIWFSASGTLDAQNVSITNNTTTNGLGAGLRCENVTGTLAFSTITSNAVTCGSCSAGGLYGMENVTLVATVIADNMAPSPPTSCQTTSREGGGNVQWPSEATPCTGAITFADPQLGVATDVVGLDGTYRARPPLPNASLTNIATGCPATDIRGNPRPEPCTAGAVEP